MSFTGFDASAIALLRELPGGDAETCAARKASFNSGVVEPGAELIETVAEMLDAELIIVRRSSVSCLHRDLRFAGKDAARYKDHLLLTTWSGPEKKFAATLWIRVDADHVGFASGMAFDPKRRERWRAAVGGAAGAKLAGAIEKVESRLD